MVRGAWRGELTVGDRWALWRGAVGENAAHRHLSAQAVVAPGGAAVEDAQGRVHRGRLLLIDPLVRHRLLAGADAEVLLVETALTSAAWRQIECLELKGDRLVLASERSFWNAVLEGRVTAPAQPSLQDAMAASLAAIDTALIDGPVMLKTGADAAGLSVERYRHRFVDVMGLPFRRYVLWRRLTRAFGALAAGRDVTSAAHGAGFADSAHMARTVKAMLGVSARQIVA